MNIQAWLGASGARLSQVPWPAWVLFALGLLTVYALPALLNKKLPPDKRGKAVLWSKLGGVLVVAAGVLVALL
ncbi:MAG: hypothetical protein PHD32_05130 [Eubacteriales bacterium]|nr:hypothetical protein [Eubacteriales bacterium]